MSEDSPLRALLEASANSPLNEADPNSLNELARRADVIFNTLPLATDENNEYLLTNEMIALAALYYQKRTLFSRLAKEKSEQEGGKKPGRKSKDSVIEQELNRQQVLKLEI